jgi:hypothetical protein
LQRADEEDTVSDVFTYRHGDVSADVTGFDVEATDGRVGTVKEADLAEGLILVDMGLMGPKVILPAGAIDAVDEAARVVRLSRTTDEVKNAPEFDGVSVRVPGYRAKLENYEEERRARAARDAPPRPGATG